MLAVTAHAKSDSVEDDKTVLVYTSHDGAQSFSEARISVQDQTVVGPRVFATHDGGFMLFASLGARELASDADQQQYERFSFSPSIF